MTDNPASYLLADLAAETDTGELPVVKEWLDKARQDYLADLALQAARERRRKRAIKRLAERRRAKYERRKG